MFDLSRSEVAGYGVAACLVVVLGIRYIHPGGSHATSSAGASTGGSVRVKSSSAGRAVVDITGAVRRPGVYRLPASARVEAAVRKAGGATHGADLSAVNLAAKVTDGVQIVVPEQAAAGAAVVGTAPPPSTGAPGGPPSAPVNLNTATAEQLDELDGVGPVTAQKILQYRQQHGGFGSVSELGRIPGIGPKRLADLRGKVTG